MYSRHAYNVRLVVLIFIPTPTVVLIFSSQVETNQSQWGNSFRTLQRIVKDEGSYSALYRGLMPNMIGNSVSWALYFLW